MNLHYYTWLSIINPHLLSWQQKPAHTIETQIFTFTYISLAAFCSRGKDFQSADLVGVIATAIWDMFLPVSEWVTKRAKNNFTFKYYTLLNPIKTLFIN